MPFIGETIKDKHSHTLMWLRCEHCGNERWVRCVRGVPRNHVCMICHGGGHYNPNKAKRGKDILTTTEGYAVIHNPIHPRAWKNGGMRRSRFILEQALGRLLREGMVVHHINGNVQDDRPENLLEISRDEHTRLHHQIRRLSKLEVEQHINTKNIAKAGGAYQELSLPGRVKGN